jgi:alanine racemase
MHNQSILQVDLSAIEENCAAIRAHIGSECKFCAVVKADGYGLGALRVGSFLARHADMLAVYGADEAGTLLGGGVQSDLLVLAPVYGIDRLHPLYRGIVTRRVHLVIHGEDQLCAVLQMATRFGSVINVQVKVDTGLHRGGCDAVEAKRVIQTILEDKRVVLTGIMTHFASAVHDEAMTHMQHKELDQVIESLGAPLPKNCVLHEANTAATMQWKWSHRNMVRVGLAWTGTVPAPLDGLQAFRPVVTWTGHLAHIRSVKRGDQVGYGGSWTAIRNSVIGIIPIGYAAGYPMDVGANASGCGAFVHILSEGKSLGDAPVIGAVCMDQIAIDLTDLPKEKLSLGCSVELLSTRVGSKASLRDLAIAAGVVPHAVISRISTSKVKRSYRCEAIQIKFPKKGAISL